ncbi:TonB family protein [Cellvibrio sp.]|uniref:TonB family protein n=1 Tax=Cellvibrio sp. TaxID=1965322 RepID=UPI0039647663
MATHVDLGKEQFIGALYAGTLSDNAEKLLTSNQAMRMELKIVAPEGVTTRRFSRWWIEGMAINNTPSLLTEQADNMVKFDGLFKGRFVQNDTIAFTFEPGKGVNISINDALLGNIASDKFFGMLLRTWIGKVPLSSEYKDDILKAGNVNAALKGRYDKIKPSKERSTEVAGWSKIKSAAELAAEKEKEAAAKSSAQTSSVDAKLLAAQKAEQAKAEAAKLEAAKLAAQKAASTPANDEDEKPALTAQNLLARQFYLSDNLKRIYASVRYPKKALERGQTGSVRVAVTINRQGNIVSASVVQASEFETLNEAALEAVNKVAPYPAVPDAIAGPTFEFTAPIKFVLQNN